MKTALRIEDLSKKFNLVFAGRRRPSTLPEAARHGLSSMLKKVRGKKVSEDFWALKDINFEVQEGERLGIIGANGAGKSTLLKIISRIYAPTTGRVSINGRVTSLLEVNTGFHPELTGRDNIYLKGVIHGLSQDEMDRKFDSIVEFAGINEFIDTPVKFYSSGMYLRLAFSVSAHLDPDIFIADEVLAVGDTAFQKKCMRRMGEIRDKGRTVLLVSHDMGAIRSLCSRCIVLKRGELVCDAPPEEAIAAYLSSLGAQVGGFAKIDLSDRSQYGTNRARLQWVRLTPVTPQGVEADIMRPGHDLKVALAVKSQADIYDVSPAVPIYDKDGFRLISANAEKLGTSYDLLRGKIHIFEFILHNLLLKPGEYSVGIWIGVRNQEDVCAVERAISFEVQGNGIDRLYPGSYLCKFSMTDATVGDN